MSPSLLEQSPSVLQQVPGWHRAAEKTQEPPSSSSSLRVASSGLSRGPPPRVSLGPYKATDRAAHGFVTRRGSGRASALRRRLGGAEPMAHHDSRAAPDASRAVPFLWRNPDRAATARRHPATWVGD